MPENWNLPQYMRQFASAEMTYPLDEWRAVVVSILKTILLVNQETVIMENLTTQLDQGAARSEFNGCFDYLSHMLEFVSDSTRTCLELPHWHWPRDGPERFFSG